MFGENSPILRESCASFESKETRLLIWEALWHLMQHWG
jgi:hypothetical protein